MTLARSSTTALHALAVALALGASACAPPMAFRPDVPMLPGQKNELGAGVMLGGEAFPNQDNTLCTTTGQPCHKIGNGGPLGGGAQLWYSHQFAKFFDFGIVGWGSSYNAAGAGLTLRFHVVETQRFTLGFETALGYAWMDGSIPIAARLSPRVWLYSAPGVGIAADQVQGNNATLAPATLRLPLGLAVRANEHWLLLVEAGSQVFLYTQAIINGGLAAAYRF